jgi:pimeloyl-ACP methyl ester carboxylesterase
LFVTNIPAPWTGDMIFHSAPIFLVTELTRAYNPKRQELKLKCQIPSRQNFAVENLKWRCKMSTPRTKTGFVNIDGAQIYYETAGTGIPFVMIHAGVADRRQWNNEFAFFAKDYQVLRYDMRGYGKSEPVDGEFSHMSDLVSLLDTLEHQGPLVMMGCSMGGGLAMDFALAHPSRMKALIMVGSGPSGLELDVPTPAKFAEVEKAFEAGDLDLTAELETQIWFDGAGRAPEQVNQTMRKLAYEMNRIALSYEARQLGKRLPNTDVPAFDRLKDLSIPVLVIVGAHDTPYILAAADYMIEKIPSARKAIIEDAAHLPNMDQPQEFQTIVNDFLESVSS